jgi:hypothetical protein
MVSAMKLSAMKLSTLTVVLLALTLSGCTFARQRINDPDIGNKVRAAKSGGKLENGVTTTKQIVEMLGSPPNGILAAPNGNGRVLLYTFGQGKTKGLTLLIFNVVKTNIGVDTALFFMDNDGKLMNHFVSTNSEDLPWEWWAFGE